MVTFSDLIVFQRPCRFQTALLFLPGTNTVRILLGKRKFRQQLLAHDIGDFVALVAADSSLEVFSDVGDLVASAGSHLLQHSRTLSYGSISCDLVATFATLSNAIPRLKVLLVRPCRSDCDTVAHFPTDQDVARATLSQRLRHRRKLLVSHGSRCCSCDLVASFATRRTRNHSSACCSRDLVATFATLSHTRQ